MCCGGPHAQDCTEVLAKLWLFLDNEIDQASVAEIRAHLVECAPCLARYDLDRLVKDLVARSCCELAPTTLRERVITTIREVSFQVTVERRSADG